MKIACYFICFLASLCICAQLPSSFKKCGRNRSDCLAKAVEDAMRQLKRPLEKYGLPNLEPLHIESAYVGASTAGLSFDQNMTYLDISGLTNITVEKFEFDFEKNEARMQCFFPQLTYEFEYVFRGGFFGVPLNFSGIGIAVLENHPLNVTFNLEEYVKKRKTYYRVVDQNLTLDADNAIISMKIFDDDKILEEQINRIFNENWKLLIGPGKGPYEIILGRVSGAIFNNLLQRVPISALFENESH